MNIQTKQQEAINAATTAADLSGLPQTVYSDANSCGWWHTNSLSSLLHKSKMAVTILPTRYFQ